MSLLPTARRGRAEAGLSLVEVVLAMFIFALLAMGLLTAVTKSLAVTQDNRTRVVAANLAESEIGLVRAMAYDQIVTSTRSQTVGPVRFTITRYVSPVLASGTGNACSGGALTREVYKKVGVKVTFAASAATRPVQADTIVRAPDVAVGATTGGIGASVIDRDGQPVSDVVVTTGASSGVSDQSGCVYFSGIAPGTVSVTVGRSGYVAPTGAATVTGAVGVTAGVISAPQFQLDAAATVTVRTAVRDAAGTELSGYAFPRTTAAAGVVPLLDNPDRTTVTRTTLTGPATSAAADWTVQAYPFVNGYEAHLDACGPGVAVTTPQGGTVPVTLPLAGLDVQLAPRPPAVTATLAGRTVQAVSTGTCAITYTSPVVTAADGSLLLALPPGGWLLSVVGDTAPAVAVTTAAGVDPVAVPLGVAS